MGEAVTVFPPGEFIKEELDARDWTQNDLAAVMGRPVESINRVIKGKSSITPETAKELAAAFGTSAEVWLNLENAFRLSQLSKPSNDVERRAKLFSLAPVTEMSKRGWLDSLDDVDCLERQLTEFFEVDSVDDSPNLVAAARKSSEYGATTPSQSAWLYRAKHLAAELSVGCYSSASLLSAVDKLQSLSNDPSDVSRIPNVLADAGVRFVIVEHLQRSKIDGAAFWLDETNPVIAMSLRYDRIDYFWHTLGHEIAHILNEDGLSVDCEMNKDNAEKSALKPEIEQRADLFAAEMLVAADELNKFISRVKPLYSKQKVRGFAQRIGVHPGIVIGQLQYRGEISYSHSREMLAKVRGFITSTACTDGNWR